MESPQSTSVSQPTASPPRSNAWQSPQHKVTVYGVLAIVAIATLFDGYDLVVYGAVLSSLLENPEHIGQLSPAVAGTLGSWAMIGVLVGALTAGAVGDRLGRRRVFLVAIAWFSLGMAATAMAQSIVVFGVLRFITGVGVGFIVATGGAIVAEFAPPSRRNLFNAIAYSGVPAGGVMASLLALALESQIGWRGLFLIGGSPLLFLLPMAWFFLPESPRWLAARGHTADGLAVCAKYGLPEEQFLAAPAAGPAGEKTGFAGIFSRNYVIGTALIGTMSFIGLLSTYGLNTWLPKIMQGNGASSDDSLYSLLFLNGGAVLGGLLAARIADRIGAKAVITTTFTLAAISLGVLPFINNLVLMYLPIALAGVGVLGTQVLTYGLTSNYYDTSARAAGVAWCAGFGRIGGIVGPVVGGLIIGMGLGPTNAFLIFAGAALIGAVSTALIPTSPADREEKVRVTEPSQPEPARVK